MTTVVVFKSEVPGTTVVGTVVDTGNEVDVETGRAVVDVGGVELVVDGDVVNVEEGVVVVVPVI